jgi:N-methylhydantoinase A
VPARLADGIDAAVENAGTAYVVAGIMRKPALAKIARGTAAAPRQAVTGKRPVYFHCRGFVETRTFARAALRAGNRIAGPALIEEHASTTVLMGGDRLEVDAYAISPLRSAREG